MIVLKINVYLYNYSSNRNIIKIGVFLTGFFN
jgi:hypothetical protein